MAVGFTGIAFAMTAFTGGLSSPLAGILCAKIGRPAVITLGICVEFFALQFIGPTRWFHLPHSAGITFTGLAVLGVGMAAVQVSTLQ